MTGEQLELGLEFPEPRSTRWSQVRIAMEAIRERRRQDDKWGRQDHPFFSYFGGLQRTDNKLYETLEATYKWKNQVACSERGEVGWDTILLEEVFEALAKAGVDDVEYEKELVQVIAVAMHMIEANQRRRNDV